MKSMKRQCGALDIETENEASHRKLEEAAHIAKARLVPSQSAPLAADNATPTPHKTISRRNAILATSFAIAVACAAHLYRYEVIPVAGPESGLIRYIVKDRWTGDIEVVWHTADGKMRRDTRGAFSE